MWIGLPDKRIGCLMDFTTHSSMENLINRIAKQKLNGRTSLADIGLTGTFDE